MKGLEQSVQVGMFPRLRSSNQKPVEISGETLYSDQDL